MRKEEELLLRDQATAQFPAVRLVLLVLLLKTMTPCA